VAQEQGEWSEAERCLRESLALNERLGNVTEAAMNCNGLAFVAEMVGRPTEAEGWYKRAMELNEQTMPSSLAHARNLNNLAALLKNEVRSERLPRTRLTEARNYAERALEIMESFDPSAGIWTTLSVLADIADLKGQTGVAQQYRRRERECFAAFAGNRSLIDQQFRSFIETAAAASRGDARARAMAEALLPELEQRGWRIASSVLRIWIGERDWHALVEGVDHKSALLVLRVLETLAESPEKAPATAVEHTGGKSDNGAEEAEV
jgi:tetratricopeptide (TPR) repeat protein